MALGKRSRGRRFHCAILDVVNLERGGQRKVVVG